MNVITRPGSRSTSTEHHLCATLVARRPYLGCGALGDLVNLSSSSLRRDRRDWSNTSKIASDAHLHCQLYMDVFNNYLYIIFFRGYTSPLIVIEDDHIYKRLCDAIASPCFCLFKHIFGCLTPYNTMMCFCIIKWQSSLLSCLMALNRLDDG